MILHRLVLVYTCEYATLLGISCRGSVIILSLYIYVMYDFITTYLKLSKTSTVSVIADPHQQINEDETTKKRVTRLKEYTMTVRFFFYPTLTLNVDSLNL